MKKIIIFLILFINVISGYSKNYPDIWNNNAIGVGYTYTNIDAWKDNNINLWFTVYGLYCDISLGTNLKDYCDGYAYNTSLEQYSFDIGYEFPIYADTDFKILAGPIIGVTEIGNTEYYYDYYYGNYNYFDNEYSYFNFGVVASIVINKFQLNTKISKTNIGVSIGYHF